MNIAQIYSIYIKHPVICTDTRKLIPGSLFLALKGENFDGNRFASEALDKGAAYAVVSDRNLDGDKFIYVQDTLATLQDLARHHRRQYNIPFIAITGSNGKTTTKELISNVLQCKYHVHATPGNYNNHIGVPLTLLSMPQNTEIAIIEMGANHIGEISLLCEISEPTHGIITNIGKAHLEGFGDIEGVKKAKGELFEYLRKHNGIAFLNKDEKYLDELCDHMELRIKFKCNVNPVHEGDQFGYACDSEQNSITFKDSQQESFLVYNRLFGDFNSRNIMSAITFGLFFQVDGFDIKNAIEGYVPDQNRSQVIKHDSNLFVLDAYNANPESMKNSIRSFSKLAHNEKIIILGAMKELGAISSLEHQELLDYCNEFDWKEIILVGEEFRSLVDGHYRFFPAVSDLKSWFWSQNFRNTAFLLKGSRAVQLELLLKEIV
jgi:UDP-N-acetylmuramoyl-tripeptide--D-alanyl-D-alanine ligase